MSDPAPTDPNHDLNRFRAYLTVLAQTHMGNVLRAKVDPSDVVQQALLEAHRQRETFQGDQDKQVAGWLRRILATTLADTARGFARAKRDPGREQAIRAALDESSARMEHFLVAEQSSPSQRMQGEEQVLRLSEALSKLPERERQVLVMRHCQGMTLADIAARLDCSPPTVAALLHKGTTQLRSFLSEAAGS